MSAAAAAAALIVSTSAFAQAKPPRSAAPRAAMFRGNPAHTGVYPVRGVPKLGGIAWRVQTDGPIRSSPTVTADRVYVGSNDGRLYAIERTSGRVRWRYDARSPITSSPAVWRGLVLVAAENGTLLAVDATTGRRRWSIASRPALPFPWGFEGRDYFVASPAVVGDVAIFAGGDGIVYAVDAATGRVRWRHETGTRLRSSPAAADGTIVLGGIDGAVYAINLADGTRRWRHETEGASLSSEEAGFDRRTIQSSPAIADGLVFVGSRDAHVYALDLATGERRWRTGDPPPWIITSPAVADGRVFAGSSDGRFVQALDARTGRELWRARVPSNVFASPSLADSTVYAADVDGTLVALDVATGRERWRTMLGAGGYSTPTPDDGMLFVGSDDGSLVAFRAAGGAEPRRAVFYDSTLRRQTGFYTTAHSAELLRAYFAQRGYELLDARGLAAFMSERVADGAPSVVVFAQDHAPASVAPIPSDTVLFRRYLNAGGKVVWVGEPPKMVARDTAGRITGVDTKWTTAVLGLSFANVGSGGILAARPTAAGRAWGLSRWGIDNYSLPPERASVVLATDESGAAGAWVRSYGGPPGTGFVFLWGQGVRADLLDDVRSVAEYGVWRPAAPAELGNRSR